jgi:hypothetical protein
MKFYEDYTRFWTVCTVIGLAFAFYLAFAAPQVLDAVRAKFGSGPYNQKLIFIGAALAATGIAAVPLFVLAKVFGIDIKDKKPDAKGNELDEIRDRS